MGNYGIFLIMGNAGFNNINHINVVIMWSPRSICTMLHRLMLVLETLSAAALGLFFFRVEGLRF